MKTLSQRVLDLERRVHHLERREAPETPSGAMTLARARRAAAHHFGLTESELLSEVRTKSVFFARLVAAHAARKLCPRASTTELGAALNRDHTSIMNLLDRRLDAETRREVEAVCKLARKRT